MPWNPVTQMEEIIRFVMLANSDRFTLTELCEQFGISRKTAYKHLARYEADGLKGLQARSHRPLSSPQRTEADVEALILAERRRHQTWGPKKLQVVLETKHGITTPPACSTIGAILARHGLSVRRRRRPGAYPALNDALTQPTQPNEVWTFDFKGWFDLTSGVRCDPLTVCDRFSHYVLALRAQPNQQFKGTLRTCRDLMRQVGLPKVIRSDLGSPFASIGLGRLSSLSIWWIEQGIEVAFTRPASPQDNGSHERMHRDLEAEVAQSPSPSFAAQQRRFERWRHTYNHERPHEALGMQCPTDFYHASARRLNENDRALVYPKHFELKLISTSGFLAHEGRSYHVGEAFSGKRVGLHHLPGGQTDLFFANVHLGHLTLNANDAWRPPAFITPARTSDKPSSKTTPRPPT